MYDERVAHKTVKEVNEMWNNRPDVDDLIFAEEEVRVSDR